MSEQTLSPEDRKALVAYRLERAIETIEEAKYLRDGGFFATAIGRLYYACFYAASAALISKSIEANTHAGVKRMLSLHFIVPGLLDKEYGAIYSNLFDKRHTSDYSDFVYFTGETVDYLLPKAQHFVRAISDLVQSKDMDESVGE